MAYVSWCVVRPARAQLLATALTVITVPFGFKGNLREARCILIYAVL